MAKTETDIAVTSTWADLVATYAEMGGAASYVQNKSGGNVLVNFSTSGTQPVDSSGVILGRLEVTYGTAAHIWVKAVGSSALINCGLADA